MARPGSANPWKEAGMHMMNVDGGRPPSANPYKDAGLNLIQVDSRPGSANPWKDAGMHNIQVDSRPSSANPWKEAGMNSIQVDADEGEDDQIQFIVKKVNALLKTNYSLVAFDSKKGRDLLQILSDVFASLSPSMKVDLSTEDPQVTSQRLFDFLCAILNYKVPANKVQELQQALGTGDETRIYPILHWVLSRMPENAKRVYLAKYLIPLNVPEDMVASDDGVREVHMQYKQLVEQFKEAHKGVERMKAKSDADSAKAWMNELEQEQKLLAQKVENAKKKFSQTSAPNKEVLFKAIQQLRKQREEERTLSDRMAEQQTLSKLADQRIATAQNRLKQMTQEGGELNVNRMIRTLQEEVSINQLLLTDKLPRQIKEMRGKVDTVARVVTSSVDFDQLSKSVSQLEREIRQIEEKSRPKLSSGDQGQLEIFRSQAAVVSKRKEERLEELAREKETLQKFQDDLAMREAELSSHSGSKILKPEQFKQYAQSLRGKSTTYKRLKADLAELKGEMGVLERTEDILTTQSEALNEILAEMEGKQGIGGYRGVRDEIVAVQSDKVEVDEKKQHTLEELSKVVSEFVGNIRNKRNKLAPQILELRNTRQKSQAIEQEYQQKKEIYDTNAQELNDEISKLQSEVDQLTDECKNSESMYHRLNCQISMLEVWNKRAADEKEFVAGSRKLTERFKTLNAMLENETGQLNSLNSDLRTRQRDIEQNHDQNLQQMKWFKDLHQLLECKLHFYKRQASGHALGPALAGVDLNPLSGVDRLVL
eukprot:NODE_335_length_2651_cov_125.253560_g315_i0.p1 GENE.NODE_335_length_2651_cov_125.253560_g315_i0~~NODE_335_length_2651_cov_125.253560_g315_i0.p1  ORF type:complete len:767 (-),score=234.06 NODE_335_length_2651_cov_125.253560_g315_i0:282-2582(-)